MGTEFKQKLAIINAIQYDGNNKQEIISFANGNIVDDGGKLMLSHYEGSTPSEVAVTDWVMKGPTMVVSSLPEQYFVLNYEPNV